MAEKEDKRGREEEWDWEGREDPAKK